MQRIEHYGFADAVGASSHCLVESIDKKVIDDCLVAHSKNPLSYLSFIMMTLPNTMMPHAPRTKTVDPTANESIFTRSLSIYRPNSKLGTMTGPYLLVPDVATGPLAGGAPVAPSPCTIKSTAKLNLPAPFPLKSVWPYVPCTTSGSYATMATQFLRPISLRASRGRPSGSWAKISIMSSFVSLGALVVLCPFCGTYSGFCDECRSFRT